MAADVLGPQLSVNLIVFLAAGYAIYAKGVHVEAGIITHQYYRGAIE